MTIESTNKNPGSRQRLSHRKQERQAILDGTLIAAKPVITHKPRKKAYVVPTAIPVVEFENIVYENPLINEPVEIHSVLSEGMWNHNPSDYMQDDYTKPQQRKRRKHKESTEQYRKESKWQ